MHKTVVYKTLLHAILVTGCMSNDVRPLPCQRRNLQEYEIVHMWFRRFIKFADAMPNSDIKVFAILPDKVISVQYICGPNERSKRLSCTQFVYNMWKNNFPNIYIAKVGIIFIKFYGL